MIRAQSTEEMRADLELVNLGKENLGGEEEEEEEEDEGGERREVG